LRELVGVLAVVGGWGGAKVRPVASVSLPPFSSTTGNGCTAVDHKGPFVGNSLAAGVAYLTSVVISLRVQLLTHMNHCIVSV
jgi:hypothetical protein